MESSILVDQYGKPFGSTGNPLNVSLTGSKVTGPTVIDTVGSASFTASATVYRPESSKLTRGAKKRTLFIWNTLDQAIAGLTIFVYDSITGTTADLTEAINVASGQLPGANNSTLYMDSTTFPLLGADVDSLLIAITMGATAPTKNQVQIFLTEVM